jgi:hypothetical protein
MFNGKEMKDMRAGIIRVEINLSQDDGTSLWCKQFLFFQLVDDHCNESLHMKLQILKLLVKCCA